MANLLWHINVRGFIVALVLATILVMQSVVALQACIATTATVQKNIIGLQVFTPEEERSWIIVRDLGVRWVRLDLSWSQIEPQLGEYQWQATDQMIAAAVRSNVQIMALLNHMPDWAIQRADLPERFAQFVKMVIDRYDHKNAQGNIKYWEIFNEPNLPGYGWPDDHRDVINNARHYAILLQAANRAIRLDHPDAVLISAGLSPDGQSAESFLRTVYATIGRECFDVLGLHPYGAEGRLEKLQQDAYKFLRLMQDEKKPVWFTEYGTDRNGDRARLLRSTFAEAAQLDALFWFNERDIHRWDDTYGVVTYDYVAKPEYVLFKQLLVRDSSRP